MDRFGIQPDIYDVHVPRCNEDKLKHWPFPVVNGERTVESLTILGKRVKKQKDTFDDVEEALL